MGNNNIEQKLESEFQSKLIKRLKEIFRKCIILKNDPNYIQGIPDLLIIYYKSWAMLECKAHKDAPHRPNQDYYVELANSLSFGRFIYPENMEDVIEEMRIFFNQQFLKKENINNDNLE